MPFGVMDEEPVILDLFLRKSVRYDPEPLDNVSRSDEVLGFVPYHRDAWSGSGQNSPAAHERRGRYLNVSVTDSARKHDTQHTAALPKRLRNGRFRERRHHLVACGVGMEIVLAEFRLQHAGAVDHRG